MSFGRSVLLLVTVVSAVLVPIFVGHGLASASGTPFVVGAGLFVFAAAVAVVLRRTGGFVRDRAGEAGD